MTRPSSPNIESRSPASAPAGVAITATRTAVAARTKTMCPWETCGRAIGPGERAETERLPILQRLPAGLVGGPANGLVLIERSHKRAVCEEPSGATQPGRGCFGLDAARLSPARIRKRALRATTRGVRSRLEP